MAGDNQNSGDNKNPQNTQNPPARRPPPKQFWLFTTPGLVFLILWSVSAMLTTIALINLIVPVPTSCRAADMFIEGCWNQTRATGWPVWILIGSFLAQFIISVTVRVIRDPRTVSFIEKINYILNGLGLYYLAEVVLGIKSDEIRPVIATITRLSIGSILVITLIAVISYYWEYFQNKFLDAATAPPQQKGGK